jgi:hypothetical protein
MLAAKANARAAKAKGIASAAPPRPMANADGAATAGCAESEAAQPAAPTLPPLPRRWSGAAVSHRLPPGVLHPPDKYDWHRGFSRLLKRRGLRQLYIRQEGMLREMEDGLNMLAVRALHARRRGRSSGSDSESCGSTRYSDYVFDHGETGDDESDYAAVLATRKVARAIRAHEPVPPRMPRPASGSRLLSTDTTRRLAGLIPLEVFNLYGGRRCATDSRDVEPFMRYLAGCAPHLREVGLFCTGDSAVLALRRTISTKLTSLDLRHVAGLDDLTFATFLRSRTGRRLRSLSVVGKGYCEMLRDEWPYDALGHRTSSASDTDRADGIDEGLADGGAHESMRGNGHSGLRLRRAHIDVGEAYDRPPIPDVTALWMLSQRAVLGPYGVPRPV